MPFKLISSFKPTGDQPQAIEQLTKNIEAGVPHQVLLGVTGSGKTMTAASVIERTQKPILVITHNKTLCAQLYQEFKEFFPAAGVHYFVSYYDYYQPEAYIPQTDTYIEKDAKVNDEIDRLRHAATQELLTRNDVIVCASVSCIYNIGSPETYQRVALAIKEGQQIKRNDFLAQLTQLHFQRNDVDFTPGSFRVRGDVVELFGATGALVVRVEFLSDTIEQLFHIPTRNLLPLDHKKQRVAKALVFPADFWVAEQDTLKTAIANIRGELQEQLDVLKKENKLLEAQRLEQRTTYDLELLEETGVCHGIENYSRHLEFRKAGEPPFTLLDYFRHHFGKDFLVCIDESHMTIPQLRAMAVQDRIRKETLVANGFRLPSAIDNRPLTFAEFERRTPPVIYLSATPSSHEKEKAQQHIVEQLIRPTGLLEPSIEIRPTEHQIEDVIAEVKKRREKKQRTLVLTLTKRLAEAVAEYLADEGIATQWIHSEVKTLERPEILKNLREGKYDVLVGVNLLREGLDLPEVALVVILDADKEGFLRNATTLIQMMGRAARHSEGSIILYADQTTQSMQAAIAEIQRRRAVQETYNKKHGITPRAIVKDIRAWSLGAKDKEADTAAEFMAIYDMRLLEKEMKAAADNLNFERAARIRDLIQKRKKGR